MYHDDASAPDNPGWVLRMTAEDVDDGLYTGGTEDIQLDAENEDDVELAVEKARIYLGWEKVNHVAVVEESGETIYQVYPDPQCEGCVVTGIRTPATGRSKHPDYEGYVLCQDCMDEYDARWEREHHRPSELTFSKRLQMDGSGLGVHVDRAIADELGVGYRDMVEVTIRRVS